MIRSCTKFRNILFSTLTKTAHAVLQCDLYYCTVLLVYFRAANKINVHICVLISLYSAGVYCNLRLIWIYRSADPLNLSYVICVYTRSSTPILSSIIMFWPATKMSPLGLGPPRRPPTTRTRLCLAPLSV